MRNGIGYALALLVALPCVKLDTARAAPRSPELCYIANAGFVVRALHGAILIDALIREGLPDYPKASSSLNEKMEKGLPPFDDVRIVIATHVHADHFNAEAIVRHAANNPVALYVVTPQARGELSTAGFPAGTMKRLKSVYPANHETQSFEHEGLRVTSYRINHGKGVPVQNIGVMIEADGVRLFHPGDMVPYAEELAEAGLSKLGVDVAMVPFWLLTDDGTRRLVKEAFAAETVVPMHFPVKEQEQLAIGARSELRRTIEAEVPNASWLTKEMACLKIGGKK